MTKQMVCQLFCLQVTDIVMIEITRQFRFESAHFLPNHDGKCRNMHGHSYILEVTVGGDIIQSGPKEGMVMDFADLSKLVEEEIISKWDHKCLNEVVSFVPTSENLALEAIRILQNKNLSVTKVRLSETEKSFVEVRI